MKIHQMEAELFHVDRHTQHCYWLLFTILWTNLKTKLKLNVYLV